MNPRIAICVPTLDTCDSMFAHDLARMMATHAGRYLGEMHLIFRYGSILARVRENCVLQALSDPEVTHVLFLDSDMRFPPDLIERMLKADKPIVAANCSKRVRPAEPTAFHIHDRDSGEVTKIYPDPKLRELQRVFGVGTAIMMIRREVFEEVPRPWFATPWIKQEDGRLAMLNEDAHFCYKCDEADIPLYIDHDISWDVRHVGNHEFGMQDVLDDREALEAPQEELEFVAL